MKHLLVILAVGLISCGPSQDDLLAEQKKRDSIAEVKELEAMLNEYGESWKEQRRKAKVLKEKNKAEWVPELYNFHWRYANKEERKVFWDFADVHRKFPDPTLDRFEYADSIVLCVRKMRHINGVKMGNLEFRGKEVVLKQWEESVPGEEEVAEEDITFYYFVVDPRLKDMTFVLQ